MSSPWSLGLNARLGSDHVNRMQQVLLRSATAASDGAGSLAQPLRVCASLWARAVQPQTVQAMLDAHGRRKPTRLPIDSNPGTVTWALIFVGLAAIGGMVRRPRS